MNEETMFVTACMLIIIASGLIGIYVMIDRMEKRINELLRKLRG